MLGLFFGLFTLQAQENSEKVSFESFLSPGQLFSFENKSVRFIKVVSDSRCPKDVTCIWAGEAKVLISISENGKEIEEKIISIRDANNLILNFEDSEMLYSLNAIELYPYPTSKHKIEDSEYCLKIQFSKE
tara:strand:+ start:3281 stop:3673 length:393 start_codon:yes stop_codon:yes gene_type:complete